MDLLTQVGYNDHTQYRNSAESWNSKTRSITGNQILCVIDVLDSSQVGKNDALCEIWQFSTEMAKFMCDEHLHWQA